MLRTNIQELGTNGMSSFKDPNVYQIATGFPFKDFKYRNMQHFEKDNLDDNLKIKHDEDRDIQTQQHRFLFFCQDLKQFKQEKNLFQNFEPTQTSQTQVIQKVHDDQNPIEECDDPSEQNNQSISNLSNNQKHNNESSKHSDTSIERQQKQNISLKQCDIQQKKRDQIYENDASPQSDFRLQQQDSADTIHSKVDKQNQNDQKIFGEKGKPNDDSIIFKSTQLHKNTTQNQKFNDEAINRASKNIQRCDYIEFVVSLQRCNPNWLPTFDDPKLPSRVCHSSSHAHTTDHNIDAKNHHHHTNQLNQINQPIIKGFRLFNEVILIPKNIQADFNFVDPMKPLPRQWIDIIRLIDQEKKESQQEAFIQESNKDTNRLQSLSGSTKIQLENTDEHLTNQKPPLPKLKQLTTQKNHNFESSSQENRLKIDSIHKNYKGVNQLNTIANLSQSLQMQILKCNNVIFGSQVKLDQEDEIISELQRLQIERRYQFIQSANAWTNSLYKRQNLGKQSRSSIQFKSPLIPYDRNSPVFADDIIQQDFDNFEMAHESYKAKMSSFPILKPMRQSDKPQSPRQTLKIVNDLNNDKQQDIELNHKSQSPTNQYCSNPNHNIQIKRSSEKSENNLNDMELGIFDDKFIEDQLNQIDTRTKELLNIDTNYYASELQFSSDQIESAQQNKRSLSQYYTKKAQAAFVNQINTNSPNYSQTNSNFIKQATQNTSPINQNILRNILKNQQTTVQVPNENLNQIHKFEIRSLTDQKVKILNSLKIKNRQQFEKQDINSKDKQDTLNDNKTKSPTNSGANENIKHLELSENDQLKIVKNKSQTTNKNSDIAKQIEPSAGMQQKWDEEYGGSPKSEVALESEKHLSNIFKMVSQSRLQSVVSQDQFITKRYQSTQNLFLPPQYKKYFQSDALISQGIKKGNKLSEQMNKQNEESPQPMSLPKIEETIQGFRKTQGNNYRKKRSIQSAQKHIRQPSETDYFIDFDKLQKVKSNLEEQSDNLNGLGDTNTDSNRYYLTRGTTAQGPWIPLSVSGKQDCFITTNNSKSSLFGKLGDQARGNTPLKKKKVFNRSNSTDQFRKQTVQVQFINWNEKDLLMIDSKKKKQNRKPKNNKKIAQLFKINTYSQQ